MPKCCSLAIIRRHRCFQTFSKISLKKKVTSWLTIEKHFDLLRVMMCIESTSEEGTRSLIILMYPSLREEGTAKMLSKRSRSSGRREESLIPGNGGVGEQDAI